tara:strand:+ start:8 stop:181 length:174 start_codon:yes stop_codon:yes gene_type:complete
MDGKYYIVGYMYPCNEYTYIGVTTNKTKAINLKNSLNDKGVLENSRAWVTIIEVDGI